MALAGGLAAPRALAPSPRVITENRPPKVSVVMAVYNGQRFVREAIDSILSQTFSDFEFIIVDDASSDRTPRILDGYQDPRIILVHNPANSGPAISRNKAFGRARGDYVAIQDSDDISLPSRIEKQTKILDENPKAAFAYSAYVKIDQDGRERRVGGGACRVGRRDCDVEGKLYLSWDGDVQKIVCARGRWVPPGLCRN